LNTQNHYLMQGLSDTGPFQTLPIPSFQRQCLCLHKFPSIIEEAA